MKMTSRGYRYKIESRSGNIALVSGENHYGSVTWEVWKIRQTKIDQISHWGKPIPAGSDIHPSPGEWGLYGFSYGGEAQARAAYYEKRQANDSLASDSEHTQETD